jgi:4-hydroxyphenylacetate 3-monooxygenase
MPRAVAAIYDMKPDPANREIMSFTEGGDAFSMYYLRARTQEDLRRRMRAHEMIAEMTYGFSAARPIMSRALSPAWP